MQNKEKDSKHWYRPGLKENEERVNFGTIGFKSIRNSHILYYTYRYTYSYMSNSHYTMPIPSAINIELFLPSLP
jgi:hypothetical protein